MGDDHAQTTLLALVIGVAAIVAACSGSSASPSPSAASAGGGLTGATWQLTAITEKVPAFQGVVPAAEQPNYTIEFKADGSFARKRTATSWRHLHHDGTDGLAIVPGR